MLTAPAMQAMLEGGVPIVVDGDFVGAVGVSGVKSEQDVQIAGGDRRDYRLSFDRFLLAPSRLSRITARAPSESQPA
jgi:hypothetical protein